jgi:hypothetical protein
MLWYRFGHRGHGLVGVQELGLGWLGPGRVQDWADTMFARGNAAMWFSSQPPAALRLDLKAGSRQPSVPLEAIESVRFPAHMAWTGRGVALSYLTDRSAAAVTTLEQIARRAREVLRFQRGVVYDLKHDYEPLDGTTAHCLLAADCEPDHAALVAAEVVRAYDDIAKDGLTDEEIRRAVRGHRDNWEIPQSRLGMLDGTAFGELMARPYEAPAAIMAEYEALDAQSTGRTLRDAASTLLLASAGSPPVGHDWKPYPNWSTDEVTGRTYGPPGLPFLRRDKRKDRLTVGPDGVTWHSGDGGRLTVRYRECVAARHWEGDVRELWGADGFGVHVAADQWRDGAAIVAEIDAQLDPAVVACSEHGVGALEDTGDPATSATTPTTATVDAGAPANTEGDDPGPTA